MDGYPGVYDEQTDSTKQQERHYFLLSELQTLVKDLPRCVSRALRCKTLAASIDDAIVLKNQRHVLNLQMYVLFSPTSSSFQQRLSYTTLSDLALALIDGTVYEIVQGLLDIQHLTERNLYNQRQKIHGEHRGMSVSPARSCLKISLLVVGRFVSFIGYCDAT